MLQNVQKKKGQRWVCSRGFNRSLNVYGDILQLPLCSRWQWILGTEWAGESAGSPSRARVRWSTAPATQLRSGLREQHSMSVEGEAQEWCSGGWCSATKMGGCFSQSFPEERWKYQRQAAHTRLCNSWSLVGFKQQQPCQVQDKILIWELQVNFVRYLTYMHQIK